MSSKASPDFTPEMDYQAIESAVMETARGRWFLSEFSKRHRTADTEAVLAAITRMQEGDGPKVPPDFERRLDEVLKLLANARSAPQGAAGDSRPVHLRAMQAAENAIGTIRRTADKIREVAFELRETARLEIYAQALELYCADLATAAGLQEGATRQLTEIAALLGVIEGRVASLASSPDDKKPEAATNPTPKSGEQVSKPEPARPVAADRPAAPAAMPNMAADPGKAKEQAPQQAKAPSGVQDQPAQPKTATAGDKRAVLFVRPDGMRRPG